MANILELIGRIRMDSAQAEGAIGRVTRGTDGLNISSRKAESAVKNFASVIRSGQDPVEALADSVSNLTRAFGLGIGATVAVVGVVEVIKSFISEADKMNKITDKLNATLSGFRDNTETLDFGGAIKQIKAITAAIKESQDQASGQGGGVLARAGKTLADMMGLSDYRLKVAQDLARNELASAKSAASIAIDRRIEMMNAEKISKYEAQKLEIFRKYEAERRAAKEIGILDLEEERLKVLEINDLRKIVMAEMDERAKKTQQELDDEKQRTERINEMRLRAEEKIAEVRKKQIEEQKKFFEEGLKNSGTLLDRIKEAAQRLGRKDIVREVDAKRKEEQRKTDEGLIKMLGRKEYPFDPRRTGELESMRIGQFAAMEGEVKRQENAQLFNQVDAVRFQVNRIAEILERRLGVPVLRTAY